MRSNDDLWIAIRYNSPESFTGDDIVEIVAEVPGANDEFSWWWILRLNDGRFVLFAAWCDYTGWDCQSGIVFESVYSSAMEAAKEAPEDEDWSHRNIKRNLVNQMSGEHPKFTYIA